ncbi:MAG: hypothetical protein MUC85_02080 [Anaerolineales bacterium]|nr:hypothetical protein [Anaerolineales bacterium]
MEIYTLPLALLDFIPNIAFLVGAYFLVQTVILARGKPCSRMCMAGSLLVFSGGILKATWKLIFTLGIADIQWMSQAQFILLAPGFLALLVTTILLARTRPIETPSITMAMAAWKIPLLAIMTLSSLGAQGILTYISFKRKARVAASLFIVAVLCMLGMSGMASGSEQTVAAQWIEESMNTIGQIAFAAACWLLYRNYTVELTQ